MSAELDFLNGLIEHKLLISTGVKGVYGKGAVFEDIIQKFDDRITREGKDQGAEVMRFPPLLNRKYFEKVEYMKSFPQLAGIVHSFQGTDAQHKQLLATVESGGDWSAGLPATQVVLTPAACYPVYPTVAGQGPLPANGRIVDVYSFCFRHEPSDDPARQQMFRMREYIRIGEPSMVMAFRETWIERGQKMMGALGLDIEVVDANDPFFGRTGKMLAMNQRDQHLKFELTAPIVSQSPTALLSFNYHQDHFGHLFDIKTSKGETAHTACVGFGMERVALALIKKHGFAPVEWPAAVRAELKL